MKTFFTLLVVFFSLITEAGVFLEPVAGSDKVFRGRAPKAYEYSKLVDEGITQVLIFKNQTKNEVDKEIEALEQLGFDRNTKIHHVEFPWKEITSQKKACEMVVEALAYLVNVQKSKTEKILFHCTVGEDRTGLLAGLFAQLIGVEDTKNAYKNQMCKMGYSSGNPMKQRRVSEAIDENLTPIFEGISNLIKSGKLSMKRLDASVCGEFSGNPLEQSLPTCNKVISDR